MPVKCDFNLGESKHEKASQRPKCINVAENQIHIGGRSWLHVCNVHLKEWAMFNGARWFASKRAQNGAPTKEDFLTLVE